MGAYFRNITDGVSSILAGMRLTFRHALDARNRRKNPDVQSDNFFATSTGMVTTQYPKETVPIPDHGRYRLHNEMDDCIVCDKCAKVCPVDCIEIEPIKATGEVGRTSDGSVIRLYAAKFDIDMAKCFYCGLCTTVCPTESLTMTRTFDYSEFDVREMVYAYGNLTPEEAQEKRDLLEQFQLEKAQGKPAAAAGIAATAKPAFRPTMKPKPAEEVVAETTPLLTNQDTTLCTKFHPGDYTTNTGLKTERISFTFVSHPIRKKKEAAKTVAPVKGTGTKPAFRPTMKPKAAVTETIKHEADAPKPAFRPTMKPKTMAAQPVKSEIEAPKPAFRPTMKPKTAASETVKAETEAPKPAFRPTMKPKTSTSETIKPETESPKPAFRPTMKPKTAATETAKQETEAPKPAFRPTMKPKTAATETVKPETEAPKPAFRPTMKPKTAGTVTAVEEAPIQTKTFRPTVWPQMKTQPGGQHQRASGNRKTRPESSEESTTPGLKNQFHPADGIRAVSEKGVKNRPVFNPSTGGKSETIIENSDTHGFHPASFSSLNAGDRPVFGKIQTGKSAAVKSTDADIKEETKLSANPVSEKIPVAADPEKKPKVVFRPTMKPKQ